ncbi:MAG: hypothetical protein WKG01_07770 [Kofleriaceae bacterium]
MAKPSEPGAIGRPSRTGDPTILVALRVTQAERDRYQAAAEAAGVSLSTWIRAACEARAAKRRGVR